MSKSSSLFCRASQAKPCRFRTTPVSPVDEYVYPLIGSSKIRVPLNITQTSSGFGRSIGKEHAVEYELAVSIWMIELK